jgi:hypothetical protein
MGKNSGLPILSCPSRSSQIEKGISRFEQNRVTLPNVLISLLISSEDTYLGLFVYGSVLFDGNKVRLSITTPIRNQKFEGIIYFGRSSIGLYQICFIARTREGMKT